MEWQNSLPENPKERFFNRRRKIVTIFGIISDSTISVLLAQKKQTKKKSEVKNSTAAT